MGNGNGGGKPSGRNRVLKPGQGMPQGIHLGPGTINDKEIGFRQDLELDVVMAQNLQQVIMMAGDIPKKYHAVEGFQDAPAKERHTKEALALHDDFVEMQIRLMRGIRSKIKKCAPFSGMKDLKFSNPKTDE